MSHGWIHNYYLNAASISSPEAMLGGTTPAQMASLMVAMTAINGFYVADPPDPRNWMITALISKWGIDQLTGKAVSISLGNSVYQFIQQPDGSYTPPANCTMILQKTNGAYLLQERHGRTFKFNTAGWGTNIVDQYGNSLNIAYNSSNWVSSVTDWKGRSLTFNYSSTTPKHLISVVESTGRTIGLGYSSSNDLVSVSDPENKTNKYVYDTNHQITAVINAAGQLVTSNIFNGFGRVVTQYTQGDTNKTWKISWSGWQTVEQDPAGSQQVYFYDDKIRQTGLRDALGNFSQKFYDGQDHVVMTVSPLGETNQFVFDGFNNLVATIDPLNFSNQLSYDSQNSLIRAVDPRGNATTFGYNSQFSIIGKTNGAGDFLNTTFNSDGTIASTTDAGGTTTYGEDANGYVNSVTYPNSLGSESFVNNTFGDVASHTDPLGFITTYQFNNRRQLTNSVAPTNVAVRATVDSVGNISSTTDARGFNTTNTWSATKKLLATKYPATSQGTPIVTNIYDNRDWLTRTVDPLQSATQFTNDVLGHLTTITDPLSQAAKIGYDGNGHSIAKTNAIGEVTKQFWDARGKIVKTVDGAGHVIGRSIDGAGNQVAITNRNGKVWKFQFDGANRLTNTISPRGRSTQVAFNHQGLPTSFKDATGQQTILSYDAKKRLTSRSDNVGTTTFNNDASDNLTSVSENGLTNSWTYDAYKHVSSYRDSFGNLIQYRYDANGNVTNLVYPGGKNVYYAFDTHNHPTNVTDWSGRQTAIAYDLNEHVIGISTVALTDDSGNVTDRYEYSLYGLTTYHVGKSDTSFLFNGKYGVMTDPNGLIAMNARFYNPYLCRFISADPSGFSGGLNFYAYANGNPVSYVDPYGLGAIQAFIDS